MATPSTPPSPGAQFGTGVRESFSTEVGAVTKGPECRAKATAVLEKFKLPLGLFPLSTIAEFGYNETNGLMWMKQPDKTQTEFPEAEVMVHCHRAMHGYIEMHSLKKIAGLKLKDIKERNLFVSIPYNEIKVEGDHVKFISEHGEPKSLQAAFFQEGRPSTVVTTVPRDRSKSSFVNTYPGS